MYQTVELSTLRILRFNGKIVGTGFLVAQNLAVTCAHVIAEADSIQGDNLQVQFSGQTEKINARVETIYWRDIDEGDIAFLRLDSVPEGIQPLRLAPAESCHPGNEFRSFGYAIAADVQGIHANGKIDGYLTEHKLLQLQSAQANHGISGAPVLDEKRGVVVGMITKGHTELGRNELTTFATPTETLWQVCPQLKPPTPILPRRNPIVEGINLLPYDYDQRIQNFLTEYLGTDLHPVPFGGRDEALRMLDNWLAETTPYLLLAAPAGRGKSALLVRWLDSLKARDDLALAFVPVSIRFGTNMERVFYAALAARLAFLHGDDIPASPETSTAVYRGLVSNYVSKPLANGRTLLVVLDGLDEAADWQAGADFMPGELPAGVRVVVSARFLAGDADATPWLRRLNWERNGLASAPSLTPLDRAGVADVLLKMNAPLDELSRNVDIVTELYRLSAGDPLLVGLYVGDLWAKGEEVTRLKPENLASIQPGYKGYFDRWWDDQKKLWGKDKPWLEKHVRIMRNLLAGALGALFMTDIHELEPELESDYIADALDVLQRFIICDNQNQGYTFSHPKLGQYFWDALTPSEQTHVEGCFLAWGEQTLQEFIAGKRDPKKKAEVPFYVVRNYGAHLARANQPIEKWLPLIHHQQWAQAWFTVDGAYGGYLQDVQRVWEQCRLLDQQIVEKDNRAPYLGKQIRCGLIKASLHSLAENIPAELIWPLVRDEIWTWPQAWVIIRQMLDFTQQANTICSLIPRLSKEHLSDVFENLQVIEDDWSRTNVLVTLAQYAPKDELDRIIEAMQGIQDKKARTRISYFLAQYKPEMISELLLIAKSIPDEELRVQVLIELMPRLSESQMDQMLAAARVIDDRELRAITLSMLSRRMPNIANEALGVVMMINPDDPRAHALCAVARYLPEKYLDQILDIVGMISDKQIRRASMLKILIKFLPESQLEQTLEATRKILDKKSRISMLSELAERFPRVTRETLAEAQAIGDEWTCASLLSILIQLLPEIDLAHVLKDALAIRDKETRASILSVLANRLPDKELDLVLKFAREIQDEYDRSIVLSQIAQRNPKIIEEALEAAYAVRENANYDEVAFASVLKELAENLPVENLKQVLEATSNINDSLGYAALLITLSQRVREQELAQILEAIPEIDEFFRSDALLAIALNLPPEELGQVLKATQMIRNDNDRADILGFLAQTIPEDELEKVITKVRGIRDNRARSRAMSQIEKRLQQKTQEISGKGYERGVAALVGGDSVFALRGIVGCALTDARILQAEFRSTSELNALAQNGMMINLSKSYKYLEKHLIFISHDERSELFSRLSSSMLDVVHLGTDDTLREIYEAVRDVTTWWP